MFSSLCFLPSLWCVCLSLCWIQGQNIRGNPRPVKECMTTFTSATSTTKTVKVWTTVKSQSQIIQSLTRKKKDKKLLNPALHPLVESFTVRTNYFTQMQGMITISRAVT